MWSDGINQYTDEEFLKLIKNHKELYIGSDSQYTRHHTNYVTAVCFRMYPGIGYYYKKERTSKYASDIRTRIWNEVERSISTALWLKSEYPDKKYEVHCDINSNPKHRSNQFHEAASGYVRGCGFEYKCKPESFAASGAADNHTR